MSSYYRTWMDVRVTGYGLIHPLFIKGVDEFLDVAFGPKGCKNGEKALCPCCNCRNEKWLIRDAVKAHLWRHGFIKNYKIWVRHGESWDYDVSSAPLRSPCLPRFAYDGSLRDQIIYQVRHDGSCSATCSSPHLFVVDASIFKVIIAHLMSYFTDKPSFRALMANATIERDDMSEDCGTEDEQHISSNKVTLCSMVADAVASFCQDPVFIAQVASVVPSLAASQDHQLQELAERVKELADRERKRVAQAEQLDKELDNTKAMLVFMLNHLKSNGVEVPCFDVGTPRSSISQMQNKNV